MVQYWSRLFKTS